jgi:hypothetical protein
LIVVCGLLSIVTTIGVVTFSRMIDYWGALRSRTELSREMNNAAESLRQDFAAAVSSSLIQVPLTAAHQTTVDDRYWRVQLDNDSVSFPIEAMTPDGRKTAALVRYSIEPGSKDEPNLLMRTMADPLNPAGVVSRVPVAKGVLQMRIEYEGADGSWQETWADAKAPRAVRVSLNLVDSVNPLREQLARKAVFTIHVD